MAVLLRARPRLLPPRATAASRAALGVAAAGAAVAAAWAGESPTGGQVLDALLTAALAGVVTLAAGRAHPAVLAVAAAGLAVVGAGAAAGPLAAASLGMVVAAWVAAGGRTAGLAAGGRTAGLATGGLAGSGPRFPTLGAAAGALLVHGALRLDGPDAVGGPSAVAAGALGLVLVGGLVALPSRRRRWVAGTAAVAIALAAGAAGLAAATALRARDDVDAAVRSARAGLEAARDADRELAAEHFDRSAAAFARARGSTGAWWMRPALAVPVVAQHARAVRDLVDSGAELAAAAAAEARDVDPDAIRLVDGRVDLEAVTGLEPALQRTSAALDRARRRLAAAQATPWLVDEVAGRVDDFAGEVDAAAADAGRALEAVRVVPDLLGADGERRYLLLVLTPSQSRASGGFVGNWGEITAVRGRLELARFGRGKELNVGGDPDRRVIHGEDEYVARYGGFAPERLWGNVTLSPDFPTVARVAADLYPQSGGRRVDGVVAVDPLGLAALLELTGPVDVREWPEPLTAGNAGRVLLHDHYNAFPDEERADFLGEVARSVWRGLTSGSTPGPRRLGRTLGPAVAGRHIQFVALRPAERRYLTRLGVTGAVPPVRGDSLGIFTQNAAGKKIDWFLHRTVGYDVSYDPGTGAVDARLTVRFRNDAPTTGLAPPILVGSTPNPTGPGENRLWLSVYTPLEVEAASLDGAPVGLEVERELGRNVYSTYVRIPSRAEAVLELRLRGQVSGGRRYRLDLLGQANVHDDRADVSVALAPGWRVTQADGWASLERDRVAADLLVDRNSTLWVAASPRHVTP